MKQVNKLNPFGRFCCTIGNLPTSYMESLTYEQQLMWFCKFLDEKVIPAVNNNAEAIIELQNYVSSYFENLNVQTEINNKLDEMAESGELTEIISEFLSIKCLMMFNTVSDMKSSDILDIGSFAKTLGFHSLNDGGSAYYIIKEHENENIDEMTVIQLSNNLIAILKTDNLNIKQLGAYGDDIHDDSIYFNKGIELLSDNKTSTNYSQNNTLYIPAGTYKLENTVNLSVFAKIETTGYVTINSYVDDVTFKLSPDGETEETGYNRYNYLFGELINGAKGFRVINKLNRGSTVAFQIGNANVSDTSLNYNISKTVFKYITINNFNIAIKFNPYNLYIDTFENIYCEQNDYAIVVGDENINNYMDSGENISFNKSIFSGSDIVCLYNTPLQAIDFNFNECSFDFNKCLFYSPNNNESNSQPRKISIDNSHIEGVSYGVESNNEIHGILYGQFRAYQITISNSRILQTNKYHLFYATSETSYILNLISNIINVYGDDDANNPNYQYFANDYVKNINVFKNQCSTKTGIASRLSSYNNCILRPDWRSDATNKNYNLTKDSSNGTLMIDWKNGYFNKINNTVTVVDNNFGGKSLKLTVDTTNPWDSSTANGTVSFSMLSEKFYANSNDVIGIGLVYKNMKLTTPINFYLNCYDSNDNLISTQQLTTVQKISADYVNSYIPRYFRCPVGTQSATVRFSLTQNDNAHQIQGETFEIGNISVVKM